MSRIRMNPSLVIVILTNVFYDRGRLADAQPGPTQVLAGGTLTGLTILRKDEGSVVRVESPVHLPAGASLTVGRGLTLLFPNDAGIHASGRLRVEGTPEEPVVFQTEVDGGSWSGIHISGPDSRGSVLRYLTLRDSETGLWVSLGASVTVTAVTVEKAQRTGMTFEDSSGVRLNNIKIISAPQESCAICVFGGNNFEVDGCDIDRGEGHTIGIQAQSVENISIRNCKLSSGAALGLELLDVFGNVTVASSVFKTNYGGSLIKTDEHRIAFVLVEAIRFSSLSNSGHCVKVESRGSLPGTVVVRNSVVYGCDKALFITAGNKTVTVHDNQLYLSHQALALNMAHTDGRAMLTENTFFYNSNSDRTPAVSVGFTNANFGGKVKILNNLFQQNNCKFVLRVLSTLPIRKEAMAIEIVSNEFKINSIDLGVPGDKAIVMLKFAQLPERFVFENNSLTNPGVQYDLAVGATSYDGGYVLDASRNFWDSSRTSVLQVEERVLAHHIDKSRAKVLMEPFILSFKPYVLSSMCEGDRCECPGGYEGVLCQEYNCDAVDNCTAHGNCIGPNRCRCVSGWEGVSCGQPVCEDGCFNLGECVAPGQCKCSVGWKGKNCSVLSCPENCSDHGRCSDGGVCECTEGWVGEDCFTPSCVGVNNCTGNGDCIGIDKCACLADWTGADCSLKSCQRLLNCSDHGDCTQTGSCSCFAGWRGDSCDTALCRGRNNCSHHGRCLQPDVCSCDNQWSGDNCQRCADDLWGRDCLPCPDCLHGYCHEQGFCVCDGPNWVGNLCDRCGKTFHGSDCLPLPTVVALLPDAGPQAGGTQVVVQAENLPNATEFTCWFDETPVPGVLSSLNMVECTSPPGQTISVPVTLQTGNITSLSDANFTYYSECPGTSCGEDTDPPRGVCLLGACACHPPWSGDSCSGLGLAPDIAKIRPLSVLEFQDFSFQPVLLQGEEAATWTADVGDTGIRINARTGELTWPSVQSGMKTIRVTISARNAIGSDTEAFQLTILPAYTVRSLLVDPAGPFLSPIPVKLSGEVAWNLPNDTIIPPSLPVEIRVKYQGLTLNLTTRTDASLHFENMFYPSRDDGGLFVADARHPTDTDFLEKVTWVVLALRAVPRVQRLVGHVEESLTGAITVENRGPWPLTDIRYSISGVEGLEFTLSTGGRGHVKPQDTILSEVLPDQQIVINISVQARVPVEKSFSLLFTSVEGPNATVTVEVDIAATGPFLVTTPEVLNLTVIRGTERTFEITVQNVGSEPAYDLQATTSGIVFNQAFREMNSSSPGSEFLDLDTGSSAILVVVLAPPVGARSGVLRESIVVRCRDTQTAISVNVNILSDERLNLTITVQDESSCFSAASRGPGSASVTLSNSRLGVDIEDTITLPGELHVWDVAQGYYDLTVTAPNHRPKAEVVFATPDNTDITVEMETIAVNQSWAFPDDEMGQGEVLLLSDVVSDAPFPVIAIEPPTLDLGALERGEKDVITLTLTNHGLSAAKNVTFELPNEHPHLQFSMDSLGLGDLDANGSVLAVIRVETLAGPEARNVSHLLISVLYHYTCVRPVQRKIDVILKRKPSNTSRDKLEDSIPVLESIIPVIQSVFCDPCLLSLKEHMGDIPFDPEWSACAVTVLAALRDQTALYENTVGGVLLLLELSLCCGEIPGRAFDLTSNATDENALSEDVEKHCEDAILRSVESPSDAANPGHGRLAHSQLTESPSDAANPGHGRLAHSQLTVSKLRDIQTQLTPHSWRHFSDPFWYPETLKPSLSMTGDGGMLITEREADEILGQRPPPGLTSSQVDAFLSALNTTMYNLELGNLAVDGGLFYYPDVAQHLRPLFRGIDQMFKDGFSDPLTWYKDSLRMLRMQQGGSSCAKAKLRLSGRVTEVGGSLTATLEVENGDVTSLTDLQRTLVIRSAEGGEGVDHAFLIEDLMIHGFETDNTSLVLPITASGSLTWRLTALPTAVTSGLDTYEVWASMRHRFRGEDLEVSVRGDDVTVVPPTELQLHFFYPQYSEETVPTTNSTVRTTVKISMVVKNVGPGVVRDMRVKSLDLLIVNDLTDEIERCQIDDVSVHQREALPTFRLSLGDILPGDVTLVVWTLRCDHPSHVNNITAVFTQTNAQGDTTLCEPREVFYHEVFHEVRIDEPDEDDTQPDSLVSHGDLSDAVFSTDTNFSPSPVHTPDYYQVHTVLSIEEKTEIQMLVKANEGGFQLVKIPITVPEDQKLKKVRRHDIKNILLDFNVWLTAEADGSQFLYLFDWFDSSSQDRRRKRQVSIYNNYFVELGVENKPPTFPKSRHTATVSENVDLMASVLKYPATDPDNEVTYYELTSPSGEELPFGVTHLGAIVLVKKLDREVKAVYRMVLSAYDNGEPSQSATTHIGITVLDEEDNTPVFEQQRYSLTLQDVTPVNSTILVVKAVDPDYGENGSVLYSVSGEHALPFAIDSLTGVLSTSERLVESKIVFDVTARNANSTQKAMAVVNITVVRTDDFMEIFSDDVIQVNVSEGVSVGASLEQLFLPAQLISTDIRFEVLSSVPFVLNESTGFLETSSVLDRESRHFYNVTIRAVTDRMAEDNEPDHVTVLLNVTDENDHVPSFPDLDSEIFVSEDASVGAVVASVRATDNDIGENGTVVGYQLIEPSSNGSAVFGINVTDGGAVVYLEAALDREVCAMYEVKLMAFDGGTPSLTGSVSLTFIIVDVNDNPSEFETSSISVNVSKMLPRRSEVFTAKAVDKDSSDTVSYSLTDTSNTFLINRESGVITLRRSLRDSNTTEYDLTVSASDGVHVTNLSLTFVVSQINSFAPRFESSEYLLELSETAPSGTYFGLVFADDADGDWVSYFIADGDPEDVLHIDSVSGELMTRYLLDVYGGSNLTLTVGARDRNAGSADTKTGYTTVNVLVRKVNRFKPRFRSGKVILVEVAEDSPIGTILQVESAEDRDGDDIIYTFPKEMGEFVLDSRTLDLRILKSLDREITPLYSLPVVATDLGSPPRSAEVTVNVRVTDVNDNDPVINAIDEDIYIVQSFVRLDIPIYKVTASDGDAGENSRLSFSMLPSSSLLRIHNTTGDVFCSEQCLETTNNVTLNIAVKVMDNGTPRREDIGFAMFHLLAFPRGETQPRGATTESMFSEETSGSGEGLFTTAESLDSTFSQSDSILSSSTRFSETSTGAATDLPPRALPSAAFPVEDYREICQTPVDAVLHDRRGLFFFQDGYVWRVFERGDRSIVRGYPKSISRLFSSGWGKAKIAGPIDAALYSEDTGSTYLFKEEKVWIYEQFRLAVTTELIWPPGFPESSPGIDGAVVLPDRGMVVVQGRSVFPLVEGDGELSLSQPEPVESVFPGVPTPLGGAFTSPDQKTVYVFSGQLVYKLDAASREMSADSPVHITEWMDCLEYY